MNGGVITGDLHIRVNLLLFFANLAWGASFVAARMVLTTLDPVTLASIRFLIASAILVPLVCRQHNRLRLIERSDVPAFLFLGQLGVSVYFLLQYTGLSLTSAGVASLIVVGLAPMLTAFVSAFALRERTGGKEILAFLLGFLGVGLVVLQDGATSGNPGFLLGSLCLMANALSWAIYSVLVRRLSAKYPSIVVTTGTTVSGALGLAIMSLFAGDWPALGRLSGIQWLAVAYLTIVCAVLAYLAYNYALSHVEAARAASWLYIEPLVAAGLGVLILQETVSLRHVAGGAAIFASMYILNRRPDRGTAGASSDNALG